MSLPTLDRPLTEPERGVWEMDRGVPMNYAVVARVTGGLDEAALRAALDAVQARHAQLRARVEERDGRPWFASDGVGPLPLRVVRAGDVGATDDTAAAHRVAEDDVVERFPEAGPLARATLCPADDGDAATLVLGVHHVIGDGRSASTLLRDVLAAAGAAREGRPHAHEPVADVVPMALRFPAHARGLRGALRNALFTLRSVWQVARGEPPVRPRMDEEVPAHARRPRLLAVTIDEPTTARLAARAKAEGTTLHGAFAAAMMLGIVDDSGRELPASVEFGHPIDMRAQLDPPVADDVHGFFVSMVAFATRLEPGAGLWTLARQLTDGIRRGLARNEPWCVLAMSVRLGRMLGSERLPPHEYIENWEAKVQGTGGLTNLGRVDIPDAYGPLRLETIHVAFNPSATATFSALVAGWAGRLHWSFMWPDPGMTPGHARALVDAVLARLLDDA